MRSSPVLPSVSKVDQEDLLMDWRESKGEIKVRPLGKSDQSIHREGMQRSRFGIRCWVWVKFSFSYLEMLGGPQGF